jgi:hypothetical protein
MPDTKRPATWPPYPYITRVEAAQLARCSVQQVDKYVHCDFLHPLPRRGRSILFRTAEVVHLIETGVPPLPRAHAKGKVKQ